MNPIAATWPLLLGMGVLMLGAGLQSTLLSLRGSLEGFASPVIGAIMSCYYVGYLAGTSAAPRMLRQVGHIRVFAALAAVASAAVLVQGAFVHPVPWAAMRLLTGLCLAGIYVVAESWLNDRASRANRGRLLALYMLILYIGLGSSQFLLLLASPRSPAPFMLVSALISLAMVPIVVSAQHAPEISAPRKVRYRDLYRDSPTGVVAVSASGIISSIFYSMGPVYARLNGFSTAGVATFMSVSIFAAVATQYPVGRLSDRVDRRTVIAAVCLLATVLAGILAAFGEMPRPLLFTLAAMFTGSAFTLYSLAVSHVNDKLDSREMVAASSALLRLNGLGAAVGPVLCGTLIGAFGTSAYFATLASLTGALTLYDLWRKMRRRPVPRGEKGPFIPAQPPLEASAELAARPSRAASESGSTGEVERLAAFAPEDARADRPSGGLAGGDTLQ
jgi:MFS family permease